MQVEHRQESGSLCRRFLLLDDRMPHRQLVAVTAVEVDAKKECVPFNFIAYRVISAILCYLLKELQYADMMVHLALFPVCHSQKLEATDETICLCHTSRHL